MDGFSCTPPRHCPRDCCLPARCGAHRHIVRFDAGANSPADLSNTQRQVNFNLAPFSASMAPESPHFNLSVGGRPSVGLSISSYPTQTWAPSLNLNNVSNQTKAAIGAAGNAVNSYYQSVINNIQAQINAIRQEIANLSS